MRVEITPDGSYLITDGTCRLVVDDCLQVYVDGSTVYVMAQEINVLPPNVKQRVSNKFWKACKKAHTKGLAILPFRPMP